jgi:hypothetical protein
MDFNFQMDRIKYFIIVVQQTIQSVDDFQALNVVSNSSLSGLNARN